MSDEPPPPRDVVSDFEAMYAATPPWEIGRPAFASLASGGALRGRVLDVGCGTGEHVLMAAQAGFGASGIDSAPTAIRLAEAKARDRGIPARFLLGDACQLEQLGERFDTVLDCGLFHVFEDADRPRFVASPGERPPARRPLLHVVLQRARTRGMGPTPSLARSDRGSVQSQLDDRRDRPSSQIMTLEQRS